MRAVGTDPGEANRRGSPFFLTLEIVLREEKGAIKKTTQN